MIASRVLAIIGTVLLVISSLPLASGVPPAAIWIGFLIVVFFLWWALLKWGPSIANIGHVRVALMGGVALFVSSVVARGIEAGDFLPVTLLIASLVGLFLAASTLKPAATGSSRLRLVLFLAMTLSCIALKAMLQSGLSSISEGDFWMIDLPFKQALILPHPYDFYVVKRFLPFLLVVSLLVSVVCSGLYFWKRHAELRQNRFA